MRMPAQLSLTSVCVTRARGHWIRSEYVVRWLQQVIYVRNQVGRRRRKTMCTHKFSAQESFFMLNKSTMLTSACSQPIAMTSSTGKCIDMIDEDVDNEYSRETNDVQIATMMSRTCDGHAQCCLVCHQDTRSFICLFVCLFVLVLRMETTLSNLTYRMNIHSMKDIVRQ
jgi:hypothetical protein